MMAIRVNIEAERGRLQLSKKEMSQRVGITVKTYNSYINNGAIPSTILELLHKMTGQPIDYLLGLTDDIKKGA